MTQSFLAIVYLAPLLLLVGAYSAHQRRQQRRNIETRDANIAAGMTEPASLHPVIDPLKCIGCAACIKACPEMPGHLVLGLIHGKAQLISPADCIGHGACLSACPEGAITLVFGTERRGVDIPNVGPDFQTNVPGVFVAGELGGMGLIRNAISQGRQAIETIVSTRPRGRGDILDVIIVGAGPAGFSASLAAMEKGLRYLTLEQESFGGTVAHYPRGKLVMTAPAYLPIVGKVNLGETTKEKLLGFWEKVRRDTGVQINFGHRVDLIRKDEAGFLIETTTATYRAQNVLLAIGRRGTPRKLEVPGENLTKVTYRLLEPEQYAGRRVLVVGGGDSALEAAASIAEQPNTDVTLSYRAEAFTRAKPANRRRIENAMQEGRVRVLLQSQVVGISEDHVRIALEEKEMRLPNDAVIISAGGILPSAFLKSVGIRFETKFGTA
jgi:thioredoxin reductase/NAD-dependent dihydropyrimidine dehydrogenase PreA subunit